jgi:Enoyl-CoA hydratase/isomerase
VSVGVRTADGIAEVVIDFPPVNALPVQGWRDLAAAITAAGAEPATRAVILAAEGRGFCAGVDIKEMQRTEGHEALIGANRGCFAAFAAVYDCPVPVIAAVHGFCLGGGVGLAGNADIVVAADDATFGLGYDRGDPGPCELRVVVTNLAVLDFGTAERTMRLRSVHPGVEVSDVVTATGFPLVIPDEVPVTRPPTAAELDLIRTRLDPGGARERELP